ncbi:MerC domain-containing protein [Ferruginibacter yonginensis]|uniref:MerC domain-containing protein n=1 Tax=Ferruginibacter yonginensis TaxID=1310416 RepID=A0ABV8QSX1_9BACT
MNFKINWDGLGIATSLACAIHCVVLPLLLTSLPLFGVNIIHNIVFEWIMIGIAFSIGVYALLHGFKTHHKNWMPVIVFTIGFIILCTKQFFLPYEGYFLVPAVLLIIVAHYMNYRLCTKSKCSSPHHTH